MRFLKSVLRWLSSIIFHASLFALIGAICFSTFLGSNERLKNSIAESGIYEKFIDSVISANVTQSTAQNSSIPLDDPIVQEIAKSVFTPVVLKDSLENVLDGLYSWFDGESDNLEFTIDFTRERDVLFDSLSTYAAERLDGLPPCTQADLQTANVFSLDCQPPGFYEEIVKNQVYNDLVKSNFLKDSKVTEQNLPLTKDGKTISEKFNFAPFLFKVLQNGVYVFGGIFVVASIFYIALRRPLRNGMRAFGKDLLANGIMLGIFTVFYSLIMPRLTNSFNLQAGSSGSEAFRDVTNYFVHRLDVLIINIAIQIVAVGLVILIIEKMSRPSSIYKELAKKTGITSSVSNKRQVSQPAQDKLPPIQTSEKAKKAKPVKRKSVKRKITL